MGTEVGVLGPVRVVVNGDEVTPSSCKERTLLALLAVRNGQVLSTDRLIDELWGGLDRDRAKHVLHVRIASLRRHFAMAGADGVIQSAPRGYLLDLDDESVDHGRFFALVNAGRLQQSRGDFSGARRSLCAALGLWRGDALCDVASSHLLDAEARRLDEARLDALEDRIDVDLALGGHGKVATELDALVALYPLRERLWRQRILALYRSERQAEALRAAHEVHQIFSRELGLDVEPALRALEAGVREQRPELHWSPPPASVELAAPPVRYARARDGVHVAYQVAGDGPVDLIIMPGYVSHLDTWWEAYSGRLVRRLAAISRLILFDKRGTGLSDRPSRIGIDEWMIDLDTVLDATASHCPVLFGMSAGVPIAIRWAAEHPAGLRALVLYAGCARRKWAPDYPIGTDAAELDANVDRIEETWGQGGGLGATCPSVGSDSAARVLWAAYQRKAASPGAGSAYLRTIYDLDVRASLPSIAIPTLVMHPMGDRLAHPDHARYITHHIPGARLHLLDSADHLIWFSDAIEEMSDTVAAFINSLPDAQH